MKRLMISAFAVAAVLVAATTVLRSQAPATSLAAGTAGMMPVQELLSAAGASRLPIEEFEDHSLVYSAAPKH